MKYAVISHMISYDVIYSRERKDQKQKMTIYNIIHEIMYIIISDVCKITYMALECDIVSQYHTIYYHHVMCCASSQYDVIELRIT